MLPTIRCLLAVVLLLPSATAARYDYIVVGGGTAGSVIASRLSRGTSYSVLLLEEGLSFQEANPYLSEIHTPRLASFLVQNPDAAKTWNSERNPYAFTSRTKVVHGRGLGGSSRLADAYTQPTLSDFDAWGIPGWAGADLLPYLQSFQNVLSGATPGLNGVAGPVPIAPGPSQSLTDSFISAVTTLGNSFLGAGNPIFAQPNPFLSGTLNLGVGPVSHTQTAAHVKVNAADAYLTNPPSNLKIIEGAKVIKVLVTTSGTSKIAYAVQYLLDGQKLVTDFANKEIILSAGVYGTPNLLELSGIGNADILKAAGISTIANITGVGENLITKPRVDMIFLGSQVYPEQNLTLMQDPSQALTYLTTGSGFYANHFTSAVAGLPTSGAEPDSMLEFSTVIPPFTYPQSAVTIRCILASPYSRGSVHSRSSDPNEFPAVQTNIFADPRDIVAAGTAVNVAATASQIPPLSLTTQLLPSSLDDQTLGFYLLSQTQNSYQVVGTAKIGLDSDTSAVVNSNLLVRGFTNLRVADASVIPVAPRLYPIGAVYALAEKAADLIKTQNYTIPIKTTSLTC